MTMSWFSVLVFISLYSLCLGGVVMQKRSLSAADDDKGNIFGRMIIGQILGSDSTGFGEKSDQASNSSQLLQKIGGYIYEIIRKEHQSFVDRCRGVQHSDDLEDIFILLGEASKHLEQIVTGPSLKEILMKDPQFLQQHAKASLVNAGNRGNAMQINRNPCNGPVPDIGKVNGFYGDRSKLTLKNEAEAILDKYETNVNANGYQLVKLDFGFGGKPDSESRLGAYYATRGHKSGSVGNTVHNIIGGMYRRSMSGCYRGSLFCKCTKGES
jgi:hypothetical protein